MIGMKPTDTSANFDITRYGTFIANFRAAAPAIPPEYWIPLYGIVVSTIIGWSVPSIIVWAKAKKEGRRVREHNLATKSLYDDGKVDEKDIPHQDKLKDDVMDDYSGFRPLVVIVHLNFLRCVSSTKY